MWPFDASICPVWRPDSASTTTTSPCLRFVRAWSDYATINYALWNSETQMIKRVNLSTWNGARYIVHRAIIYEIWDMVTSIVCTSYMYSYLQTRIEVVIRFVSSGSIPPRANSINFQPCQFLLVAFLSEKYADNVFYHNTRCTCTIPSADSQKLSNMCVGIS